MSEDNFPQDLYEPEYEKDSVQEFDIPSDALIDAVSNYSAELDKARDGYKSPLHVYMELAIAKKVIEGYMKDVKEEAVSEAQGLGDDPPLYLGFLPKYQSRRNWKYDHDDEWQELKDALKARQEQMKRACNKVGEYVDRRTGETIPKAEVSFSDVIVVKEVKSK